MTSFMVGQEGTQLDLRLGEVSLEGRAVIPLSAVGVELSREEELSREVAVERLLRVQSRAWVLVRGTCQACLAKYDDSIPGRVAKFLDDREAAGWFLRHEIPLPCDLYSRYAASRDALWLGGGFLERLVHLRDWDRECRQDHEPVLEALSRTTCSRWIYSCCWPRPRHLSRYGPANWDRDRFSSWWVEELTATEAEAWCALHGVTTARPPVELHGSARPILVLGEHPLRCTPMEYKAIEALCGLYPGRLTCGRRADNADLTRHLRDLWKRWQALPPPYRDVLDRPPLRKGLPGVAGWGLVYPPGGIPSYPRMRDSSVGRDSALPSAN